MRDSQPHRKAEITLSRVHQLQVEVGLKANKSTNKNKMENQVYVKNRNEATLMPCSSAKARHLLNEGKAKVVQRTPFTIQLNWDCENNTQEIVVGLDTGAIHIGCSAVAGERVLYASETKLRTDVSKKMTRRAMYRRTRRSRKTRYRQARFNNRTRKKGWLPPSLESKRNSMVKIVQKLSKILPFTKVIVETAKFDTQKLQNPEIEGKEYQQGVQANYDNLRSYVLARDKHTCQICKKSKGIFDIHHIKQRKEGGTNKPDNLVTVHLQCHKDLHSGKIQHKFTKPKEYKHQTILTILKDYILRDLKKLDFKVKETFGYITKRNRLRLGLEKTHYNDAIAIINPDKVEQTQSYFEFVCKPKGRYQLSKGVRSEQLNIPRKIKGFDVGDFVLCKKNGILTGYIKGKMSTGYFVLSDLNGNTIVKCTSHKYLEKKKSKATLLVKLNNSPIHLLPNENLGRSLLGSDNRR